MIRICLMNVLLPLSPVPRSSSFSSLRASRLSRRSCLSISALILLDSFASSLRQHAMTESRVMKPEVYCLFAEVVVGRGGFWLGREGERGREGGKRKECLSPHSDADMKRNKGRGWGGIKRKGGGRKTKTRLRVIFFSHNPPARQIFFLLLPFFLSLSLPFEMFTVTGSSCWYFLSIRLEGK